MLYNSISNWLWLEGARPASDQQAVSLSPSPLNCHHHDDVSTRPRLGRTAFPGGANFASLANSPVGPCPNCEGGLSSAGGEAPT